MVRAPLQEARGGCAFGDPAVNVETGPCCQERDCRATAPHAGFGREVAQGRAHTPVVASDAVGGGPVGKTETMDRLADDAPAKGTDLDGCCHIAFVPMPIPPPDTRAGCEAPRVGPPPTVAIALFFFPPLVCPLSFFFTPLNPLFVGRTAATMEYTAAQTLSSETDANDLEDRPRLPFFLFFFFSFRMRSKRETLFSLNREDQRGTPEQ